jgi:hypothetical protein
VRRVAATVAVLASALLCAAAAHAGPGLLVGIDDDTVKWLGRPNGVVGVNRDLGVGALRVTLAWRRGQVTPTRLQQVYLHRIALTVALGQRVVLAVYGQPSEAPLTAAARGQFCGFVEHVLARIPAINDVVVWNEVNNPTFWQAGPAAYEALLASCWDTLHALRSSINVISSTAPHQDPGAFIADMGAAYRASGRTRPILDTFGHNVYPENSAEPPWIPHPDSTSLDQGDYPRLVAVLGAAFGGTAQPLPGQGRTTIWYLEDGFQTAVPRGLDKLYGGRENERRTVAAGDQAARLRDAVLLAYCQPFVGAFFNFELLDERRLVGWQSGLLYPNGQPKPAYAAYKQVIADVRGGAVDCSKVGAPSAG